MAAAGIDVVRFAHRPSVQPILSPAERQEAAATRYLATGSPLPLILALLRTACSSPRRTARAVRELRRLSRAGFANVGHLLLACRLVEEMRAAGIGCLHVHFAMTSAVVAMLARHLGGPPWTLTVHGPEEFDPERAGVLSDMVRSATAVVAVSEWAASHVGRSRASAGSRPAVVRLGVDPAHMSAPTPLDPQGPILCVARLDRRKGHHVLLDALALIAPQSRTFQVELIGDGPIRQELESLVDRRGLAKLVRFGGWQSQDELISRLDACRFLVMPSLAEGLPVALMEAFARARPVIATDVGGIGELVAHRANGLLVSAGDTVELSKAILELASAPAEQLSEWGRRGRRTIEAQYDARSNARALIDVWNGLRI